MRRILIDLGLLLGDDQQQEPLHQAVLAFFDQNAAQLITSPICIAEVLWLLGDPRDHRVLAAQHHLRCLSALPAWIFPPAFRQRGGQAAIPTPWGHR